MDVRRLHPGAAKAPLLLFGRRQHLVDERPKGPTLMAAGGKTP
jgi:hypothetical protein